MSEKKNIFDIFGKIVEDIIINPSRQILEPVKQLGSIPTKQSLLPIPQSAIFWDYENFPIPREIRPEIFCEALFPSGLTHRIVAKRLYGNPTNIPEDILEFLENSGFTYQKGIETGKKGVTDHMIDADCASVCAKHPSPLVVILISGDRDFLQLIQTLSKDGHDVRVICQEKNRLSQKVRQIIPYVRDRQDINQSCQNLVGLLNTLSYMLNYMISAHPKQQLTVKEFREEIEHRVIQERLEALVGHLKFLLNLPDFNWQYNVSNGIITNPMPYSSSSENLEGTKQVVIMKLGSESNQLKWDEFWLEFVNLVPKLQDQQQIITELYKRNNVSTIRARLQRKLISLCQQLKATPELEKLFKQKQFRCPRCEKEFDTENAKNQHFEAVHKCSVCSKVFDTQQAKQQHERDSHKKNQ